MRHSSRPPGLRRPITPSRPQRGRSSRYTTYPGVLVSPRRESWGVGLPRRSAHEGARVTRSRSRPRSEGAPGMGDRDDPGRVPRFDPHPSAGAEDRRPERDSREHNGHDRLALVGPDSHRWSGDGDPDSANRRVARRGTIRRPRSGDSGPCRRRAGPGRIERTQSRFRSPDLGRRIEVRRLTPRSVARDRLGGLSSVRCGPSRRPRQESRSGGR